MELENQVQPAAGDAVPAAAPEAASALTELDGLSEFTFQGEKYTPDQFHKVLTEHKTFGEQAKTYSQYKKFDDNLETDLDNIMQDPRLAERFKQVYPQRYHWQVDRLLRDQRQAANPPNAQSALPKEFLNEFGQVKERLSFFEKRAHDAEVESASAKLDAMLPPIFKKYPMSVEDQVYQRAEILLSQGQKLTEKTWERLARESHEAQQKRADQFYGDKLKSQIDKGRSGRDVGPGGSPPGQAPVKPKTFDDAREEMMRAVGAKGY